MGVKVMTMYCYQCEQTAGGEACRTKGICGKDPAVAALQDLLMYGLKGLAIYANRARKMGKTDSEIDKFTLKVLFTTVTNVNFDTERLQNFVLKLAQLKNKAKKLYLKACKEANVKPERFSDPAYWEPAETLPQMIAQGEKASIERMHDADNLDITSLQELIINGIKGVAAYTDHAQILGYEDDEIYAFLYEVLDYMSQKHQSLDKLLEYVLKTGEINLKAMKLLDKANTETFGDPEPTRVRTTPVKGQAILVSGHDLKDLEEVLKQTEGTGINVYTHGEMLPAHGYPELKKYKHLVGNYGGSWYIQQKEFEEFPGAVLMTTNCIQEPQEFYRGRIYTTGLVAWPGVGHIDDKDFTKLINSAKNAPGFLEDGEESYITVGYGRNAVKNLSDKIIKAIHEGKIKHFFLIGGCDGENSTRNYYTELAEAIPDNSVILTLACGKYRFNKNDFGEIDGIPRLIDLGQCNDAYSAIEIALLLSEAFEVDINELPLSMILSWYEQKSVAILLTLLYLGIKDIRFGPSLPAFLTPNVLDILVKEFNLMQISTPERDLQAILH